MRARGYPISVLDYTREYPTQTLSSAEASGFHGGIFGVGGIRWAKWPQALIERAVKKRPFYPFPRACTHFLFYFILFLIFPTQTKKE